ncbi:succinate dehydrogenase, hydrophobic membrane anchor protein [Phenylobacterium sp.]|uniref:succinate dehydrogenase, hydrophobic membrane anchor protein n=1 Tax=Phenylobacterium sp. TaxID=1871053 RepID=UPI00273016F5|nr:succinate dehydrogenase, hydrophobic membrane anchor protein [Phenylobacterium sp.]MDP1616688.1 succinate dehydrogenase, hydrophobic membrane anchor protein [Phenylobacterium sp.]MDP1985658.1 succinate dehydrogenase, hydrophobic membrane anchor protein [Phenylobacterium sp.]
MADFRTPFSRAHGLGAAGHGVGHWITERVTSIALIPLVLWGVFAVLRLARSDYDMAVAWLASPVNAVLLALLTVISFMHMNSGMRVVIEDYIHRRVTKAALLLLNLFVCVLFGALALFSILKVALSGGAY